MRMRKIIFIGIIIVALAFIVLCLYAFVPPVKAYFNQTVGPTVQNVFGDTYIAITTSPPWVTYIAPTLNAFCIGGIFGMALMHFGHRIYEFLCRAGKRRIEEKAATHGTKTEPIITHTSPKPIPTEEEEET